MKMKIYLISALFIVLFKFQLAAQHLDSLSAKKNRFDMAVGIGAAATYTYGGLWLQQTTPVVFIEPHYQVSNHFSLGFRLENVFASTYKATYYATEPNYNLIKASSMPSVALLIDYNVFSSDGDLQLMFADKVINPFVGVGVGTFFRGQGELIALTPPFIVNLGSSSGLITRFGVNSKRLLICAELNILNENKTHGSNISWWGNSSEYRGRSYISLKVGYKFNPK
jgi:hypothetical protein